MKNLKRVFDKMIDLFSKEWDELNFSQSGNASQSQAIKSVPKFMEELIKDISTP
jgi:hypothetical protein